MKHRLVSTLLLGTLLYISPPALADNVEVNLDVLESYKQETKALSNYTPPPMFGRETQRQALRSDLGTKPLPVNKATPEGLRRTELPSPFAVKNTSPRINPEKDPVKNNHVPSKNLKNIEGLKVGSSPKPRILSLLEPPLPEAKPQTPVKFVLSNPPLPAKRPSTSTASNSFVRKARQKSESHSEIKLQVLDDHDAHSVLPRSPEKDITDQSGTINTRPQAIEITEIDGPMGGELVDTNVQAVLAQIEPAAAPQVESKKADEFGNLDQPDQQKDPNILSLTYENDGAELSAENRLTLLKSLFSKRNELENLRLELRGFAGDSNARTYSGPSGMRRLSLDRAVKVKNFLIQNDLKAENISVRGLGRDESNAPSNRVDIYFLSNEG